MNGNAPIFCDVGQRSEEWAALRLGRPSASQFHRVVTVKGNRADKTSQTYKWQLLAERIFGVSFGPRLDRFAAVRDGVRFEEPAREQLAKFLRVPIRAGGAVLTPDKRLLASPDGWVGDVPVEIKCPQPPGQLESLLLDPRDHWPQIQGQMMIAGADLLHFWSWHPCMPARYAQVPRDNPFCNTLNYELQRFCDELDRDEAQLRAIGEYDIDLFKSMIETKKEENDNARQG